MSHVRRLLDEAERMPSVEGWDQTTAESLTVRRGSVADAAHRRAQWLLSDTSSPHWLCGQTSDLRRDAAVFLLRLVCYKPKGDVQRFKTGLDQCLFACCDCAEAYFEQREVLFTRCGSSP